MIHCQRITVRKAQTTTDPAAMQNFLEVTFFRVLVAAVAAFKAFV